MTRRPDLGSFVPQERRQWPLLLWLGFLGVALVSLQWLGGAGLSAPDLTDPTSWPGWADRLGTAATIIALFRIVAIALAWYLVGVTSVSVIAHLLRLARLARLADALAVGPVRTVVQQALGVGLAVGVVATALPSSAFGGDAAEAPATTSTVQAEPMSAEAPVTGAGTATGTPAARRRIVATPVGDTTDPRQERRVGVGRAAGRTPGTAGGASPGAGAAAGTVVDTGAVADPIPRPRAEDSASTEVRVAPGDHLWGIAAAHLEDVLGRSPTEAEVADHWLRVVETNRHRLVVRSNPDLLHPGQLLVLPDVAVGVGGGSE